MRLRAFFCLLLSALGPSLRAAAPAGAEAGFVVIGDQHSAYVRTAAFVGLVEAMRTEAADRPVAVLIDGDVFEHGNAVARRTAGEIDFAMLAALARRGPVVLNLGNHEAEFAGLADVVARAEAAGVQVVTDIHDRVTGQPFAPPCVTLTLGRDRFVVVGLGTDHLNTYRAEVRPTLDVPDPVAWARENLPRLFADTDGKTVLPILLSHAGLAADRALLPLVPDGTLFSGAHDHLQFVQPAGRTVYFQSGSWNEVATVAWLCRDVDGAAHWEVEQRPVPADGPADADLAARIARTEAANLTPADRAVIGRLPAPMTKAQAAQWVAAVVSTAAGADAAFIGNTTFGAGLPAGPVTQAEFDACVRFDGTICLARVDGARLQALLGAANQGPETPFAERRGEFQFAAGPADIDPAKTYVIATTDWGMKNSARYFGDPAIAWQEQPKLKVKAVVLAALGSTVDEPAAAPTPTATPAPGAAASAPPTGAATPPPNELPDLYATGKALFDALASDEIKAQYEFPSREQFEAFAAQLQRALENNSLEDLAGYEPQVRAALPAVRTLPGGDDYADWLQERLDYIEAAKEATAPSPSPGPVPTPTPAPVPVPAAIPYLDLWRHRLAARAVPDRADRLLPVIRPAFTAAGVPAELAWLAEVESTFNPSARSPAGARGLFQLMPDTAKELGLSTWLPDERTDPAKSARAAATLLARLHDRFGSWPLALAAYNAGPGRVQRTLARHGAKTFADIAAALPAETRMYVPKVLATIEARTGRKWTALDPAGA